ncbi:MAG: YicC/YloC family endoribonuclease, partial [Gemmatimonadota bacterium]
MTGYGEAEHDTPAGRLRLEVKTVNHRFFNTSIKTPAGFDRNESVVSEAL